MTIINALPNGANTTFSKLIWKSFGFTPLETLLKGSTPYYCVSICWFLVVGYVTLKKPNLRCESLKTAFQELFLPDYSYDDDVLPHARLQWHDGFGSSSNRLYEVDQVGHVHLAGLWIVAWAQ